MIEPDPTILLSIPVGALLGLWAYRKFAEYQKSEAEWKKNKDKYKYKGYR
jgi:hypothetical protein